MKLPPKKIRLRIRSKKLGILESVKQHLNVLPDDSLMVRITHEPIQLTVKIDDVSGISPDFQSETRKKINSLPDDEQEKVARQIYEYSMRVQRFYRDRKIILCSLFLKFAISESIDMVEVLYVVVIDVSKDKLLRLADDNFVFGVVLLSP